MKEELIRDDEKVIAGLIRGRHEMPVEEYIFEEDIKDAFDFDGIRNHIAEFIDTHIQLGQYTGGINTLEDACSICGTKQLEVYVTGLTAVTAALIDVCACNGINLVLMHYDRESNSYRPQYMGWNRSPLYWHPF